MISSDSSLISSSADFEAPSNPRIEFAESKMYSVFMWVIGNSPKKIPVGLYIGMACCNPKTLATIPRREFRSSFLFFNAVSAVSILELPERFTSLVSLFKIMAISSVDWLCNLSVMAQMVRPTATLLLKVRISGDLYITCAVCFAVSLLWQSFSFLLPVIFALLIG
eukprot:TRINITY_DN27_c0_g1_i14.p7 TRINITY_DN27_c0_g1~~TRINITY_DN27_c0_g1_i14.p7  ORF type:complete len:166 (+),score=5.44 TRINITY_DN27_c0_g1_i14:2446-2943(+)